MILSGDQSGSCVPGDEKAKSGSYGALDATMTTNIHEEITQFSLAEKGVQLFCNMSAKLVTQVQITNRFLIGFG